MRTPTFCGLTGFFLIFSVSACGVGSAVSTSGSLASNGSGVSSASFPGSGGGSGTGTICGKKSIQGQIIPNVDGEGDCGVEGAVLLQSVSGVALSSQPTVTCDTARALNDWVADTVKPVMSRAGADVETIQISAHYACRGMNGQNGGGLSEHAHGRAIDVSGFILENQRQVRVHSDWNSPEYGLALREIHSGACGPFRTTLGPGSDGFHEDHLHYDLGQRGSPLFCR